MLIDYSMKFSNFNVLHWVSERYMYGVSILFTKPASISIIDSMPEALIVLNLF